MRRPMLDSLYLYLFKTPLLKLLALVLSRHAKRLFYFASLYARILPLEELKSDVLSRLNRAMNLASSDDALMMPAVFSRVVWTSDDIVKVIHHNGQEISFDPNSMTETAIEDIERRAHELVCKAPFWMRFATFDEMKNETMKFLKFTDQLELQAA